MDISSLLHSGYSHPVHRSWQATGLNLTKKDLVFPLFITDQPGAKEAIPSLPNQYRWGVDRLPGYLESLIAKGLSSVLLFGAPTDVTKDAVGSAADDPNGPVISTVKMLRYRFPDLHVGCDVCLCAYTSHGHCGILYEKDTTIDNERTVTRLAEIAVAYANAGAHFLGPSDMMDGRIITIKRALASAKVGHRVALMSYSAKFASVFYGPFRDATNCALKGDRKCYQLPPIARGLARRATARDVREGADVLMVKPGGPYLDIIRDTRELAPDHPIAVYQVSGECAALYHAAKAGVYDLKAAVLETLAGFQRAGANIVVTYFTPELLDWLEA